MNQIIKQRIEDSISVKTQILNNQTLISQIENLALAIQNIFTYNGKIFFCRKWQ